MADLIVLGGAVGIEKGIKNAGYNVSVPFTSGRGDASQEQTDLVSFGYLEPKADGFRNFIKKDLQLAAEELLIDKAQLLTLSIPEMSVLIGGLRVLGTNYDASKYGVFTDTVDTLSNDFFVNILDFSTTWKATSKDDTLFEGTDRKTGEIKYRGTRADLIFGSNTELRAVAEVYAADDAKERFVQDFVAAWTKVMHLDCFDLG
jgi:catalase-peroxidase